MANVFSLKHKTICFNEYSDIFPLKNFPRAIDLYEIPPQCNYPLEFSPTINYP